MEKIMYEFCKGEACSFGHHFELDLRKRKEMKNLLCGISSIGFFLHSWLRLTTSRRLTGNESRSDDFVVGLGALIFDLLYAENVFNFSLPYILALVGQSSLTTITSALATLRVFIIQLSTGFWHPLTWCWKVHCGTWSMGRDLSVFGRIQHIGRAVGMMDDPGHHRRTYRTFQMIMRRCIHPAARCLAVECESQEAGRVVLAAQMVMEMKDAVNSSDELAWDKSEKPPEGNDRRFNWRWHQGPLCSLVRFHHCFH